MDSYDTDSPLKKIPVTGISILVLMGLLIITGFSCFRLGTVSGEEIGVLLNKISGKTEIIKTGVTPYNGITSKLYVMDKTIQTLDMTNTSQGKLNSELKIKTIDGSDVYVGLVVQYRIDELKIAEVLATSGPGNFYKTKWMRDYVRSICREHLGELTTEEFYDSSKRENKISAAKLEINTKLDRFAIITDSIAPKKPRFYREYEEMIKKKKLADQAVLQEKSKAQAAKQKQKTEVVQATNVKNVAIEQFEGKMQQKLIEIEAQAEKARQAADAYFDQITIGAEAKLYQDEKSAAASLAEKKAEATGIEALKKALEGEGGFNMVKLEYAKKLKGMIIKGRPYSVSKHRPPATLWC